MVGSDFKKIVIYWIICNVIIPLIITSCGIITIHNSYYTAPIAFLFIQACNLSYYKLSKKVFWVTVIGNLISFIGIGSFSIWNALYLVYLLWAY